MVSIKVTINVIWLPVVFWRDLGLMESFRSCHGKEEFMKAASVVCQSLVYVFVRVRNYAISAVNR